MVGESVVAELKTLLRKLKYRGAIWEWAICDKDNVPKVHFLKITLTPKPDQRRQTCLLRASGLSLFRSGSSLKKVATFLDYCLYTRREFEKTNKTPFGETGFRTGEHTVELFGNFLGDKVTLYGTTRAKAYWSFKSERPFFMLEYALHQSVSPQLPSNLSFYSSDPPFESVRAAYKHYFSTDIGDRHDPYVGIVLPVYLAHIRSFKLDAKKLNVEFEIGMPIPQNLSLSVVCRRQGTADFRRRVPVTKSRVTFDIGFKPTSLDLALYLGDLQIDFVQQLPRPHPSPMQRLFSPTLEKKPASQLTSLFNSAFLKKQPTEIRICLEQADKCCANQLWIPTSLMLRKALDMAVNLKMKQLGKESELYDEQKNEKPLPVRLRLLASHFPSIKRDIDDLLTIKWFGDKGAHSKMELCENDIRSIVAPRLRAFLTDLELKRPKSTT